MMIEFTVRYLAHVRSADPNCEAIQHAINEGRFMFDHMRGTLDVFSDDERLIPLASIPTSDNTRAKLTEISHG